MPKEINNHPLVVVVTRLGHTNEWEQWGFDKDKCIACIGRNLSNFKTYVDLDKIDLEYSIEKNSAWIINGDKFWFKVLPNLIGIIQWKNLERDVVKYIHVGASEDRDDSRRKRIRRRAMSEMEKDKKERANFFLKNYNTYGLGGGHLTESEEDVAKFGCAVASGDKNSRRSTLRKLCHVDSARRRKKEEYDSSKSERFSTLKHRLSHRFIPVSIDLQGWRESGFSDEYAEEISNEYNDSRISKILGEADETLINIHDIVYELDEGSAERINEIRYKISEEGREPRRTLSLLCDMDSERSRERLQNSMNCEGSFQSWFTDLEDSMDNLRKDLFQS